MAKITNIVHDTIYFDNGLVLECIVSQGYDGIEITKPNAIWGFDKQYFDTLQEGFDFVNNYKEVV